MTPEEFKAQPFADHLDEVERRLAIDWPFEQEVAHVINGKPNVKLWESIGITPMW